MLEPKNGTYVIRALLCYTVMLSNESKINKIYETQHPLAFNVWYIRHMERHMERRTSKQRRVVYWDRSYGNLILVLDSS